MTKAELLERISSAELTEWKALYFIRHKEQEKENKEVEKNNKPKRGRGKRR